MCRYFANNSVVVASAINTKTLLCFGEGISVTYVGKAINKQDELNRKWGEDVKQWLERDWFNRCISVTCDIHDAAQIWSRELDIVGEFGVLRTKDAAGYPRVRMVSAHEIGSRSHTDEKIEKGDFKGCILRDGVFLKGIDVMGYRMLGETADKDVDYPVSELKLYFVPLFANQIRGVSKMAVALTTLADHNELGENLLKQSKLDVLLPVIHTGKSRPEQVPVPVSPGETHDGEWVAVDETDPNKQTYTLRRPKDDYMYAGMMQYIESADGDIKIPELKRMTNVTLDWLTKIEKDIHNIIELQYSLLHPEGTGPGTRSTQILTQLMMSERRGFIEKPILSLISWAIGVASNLGLIKTNFENEWYFWNCKRPGKLTIDAQRDWDILLSKYLNGFISREAVMIECGYDPVEMKRKIIEENNDIAFKNSVPNNNINKPVTKPNE